MMKACVARTNRLALVTVALLCLGSVSFGEEDARKRIRETKEGIKASIKACRKAEKAGETVEFDGLREQFASLAVDARGLQALAEYQDHPTDWVALLAVRALAEAPDRLRLLEGKILVTRVDARYMKDDRRPVYVERVRALGRTGYLGAVGPLQKALIRTKDPAVCLAIVEALGRLGDPSVVKPLLDRLNTGAGANLRGKEAGSQARRRSQNPRQQKGPDGKKNNVKVTLRGKLIETLAADVQPADDKKVVNEIYATIEKLLGERISGWHAIDRYVREHRADLKKAEAGVRKKRREQEKEISKLLR
jgi:hypothetical protein